jgi:FkbM family methyltransferase
MSPGSRSYVRELIEDFPGYAVRAGREWGWTGFRIAFNAYVARFSSQEIESPIGRLRTHNELLNFLDNFCANELRCQEVENHLRESKTATVIDLGVNVGVSVRWWLSCSPTLRVIGIDMITEALEFTSRRIAELGFSGRWIAIHSAVGESAQVVRFPVSDPLDGMTSLRATIGSTVREVSMSTLDQLLISRGETEIDLLKIDIEGHAGFALQGATQTLQRTRYVCVESHNDEETELCSVELTKHRFTLFKIGGRHMWWRSAIQSAS